MHTHAAIMHVAQQLMQLGGFMEHFAVIQSMCRIGLADGNPRFRHQVERLKDRLTKHGDAKEAEVLARLLQVSEKTATLAPSHVELSRTMVIGEELTGNVPLPVDRETGAPLADVLLPPTTLSIDEPILMPQLRDAVGGVVDEWRSFEALEKLGVAPSRSCLLYGLPGTGKTHTAYFIARRLNLPVVTAKLDGLVSSFLGTSARNIGNLFEFANRYRCILLLDEFDAIAKLRDDPHEVGEIKRIVNTLLQNLDKRASIGITIAITNHPGLLDPAIWRRFEVRIEMPLPGPQQREELVRQFLQPLKLSETQYRFLSWTTKGRTGADIRGLAWSLKRFVALKKQDLTAALLLDALSSYAKTSSSLDTGSGLNDLLNEPKRLAAALSKDEEVSFTQSAVASILGKDQATISRWLRDEE